MSIQYISRSLLALFLLSCIPHGAEAYFTTSQSALKLSENTALYTIEYVFGLEDHDLYMPVVAERGLSHGSDEKKLGYIFTEDTDAVQTQGTSAGLVLSSAPLIDGMYKIAKGTAQKMMLFVILTADQSVTEEDFALQVQHLPYYVEKENESMQRLI